MVTFTHSQVVSGMRKALQKLTLEQVADGFVAGVGGSAPRGRQTLISYAKALHWPTHQYRESIDVGACADCGMQKRDSVDVKDAMESFESGQCWNEPDASWLVDLNDAVKRPAIVSTKDDRARFRAMLDFAANRAANCTPGVFAKELLRAKILPLKGKFAHYTVYGICEGLGEVGVLPNPLVTPALDSFTTFERFAQAENDKGGSHRSDIVVPFGAWRGALGVDLKRARRVFPTVFER